MSIHTSRPSWPSIEKKKNLSMWEMNRNTDKRNEYLIFNRLCKQSCIAEILDCFVKLGSKKGGSWRGLGWGVTTHPTHRDRYRGWLNDIQTCEWRKDKKSPLDVGAISPAGDHYQIMFILRHAVSASLSFDLDFPSNRSRHRYIYIIHTV